MPDHRIKKKISVVQEQQDEIAAVRDDPMTLLNAELKEAEQNSDDDEELILALPYEDRRQRTVPQSHKELEDHILAPSERRVKQSRHQPLEQYTPPCTRSMRPIHARDVISPGVLCNELGYQKIYSGKYPNAEEEKYWKKTDELRKKFEEEEKKKKIADEKQKEKSRKGTAKKGSAK